MAATLAQEARERRDIVSGEVMAEARLIRFVAGPDLSVIPDIARKLPGRGLWVAADRASVGAAARKGLFARAARTRLMARPDLADQVEALLLRRLLAGLGLARKAGALTSGFEKVLAAVLADRAAFLVEAADGAADGRRKLVAAARRNPRPPSLIGLFASAELDLALGAENVIHTAFLAGRSADRWTSDVERLSGFRPLFPESWREEP
ncbi:MAG: RNA-binding protein [Caulobacteraceae bacterium]|nr:RNA-binding protein [Caulobacteraceae bacterium]